MRRKKGVDQSQYTSIYVGLLRIYVSNPCHTVHMHCFCYSTCRPHIPATAAMIPIRDAGDARWVPSQVFRIISAATIIVATKQPSSVLTVSALCHVSSAGSEAQLIRVNIYHLGALGLPVSTQARERPSRLSVFPSGVFLTYQKCCKSVQARRISIVSITMRGKTTPTLSRSLGTLHSLRGRETTDMCSSFQQD